MDQIEIGPFLLYRQDDGTLVAQHPRLAVPLAVPEKQLVSILQRAARAALDSPSPTVPAYPARDVS
jgi:hypothetical protein